MTAFFINNEIGDKLRAAAARAQMKPIPWAVLQPGIAKNQQGDRLALADREGVPEIERQPEQIALPFGWRVAISCEEQPAGILLHLSMSSPVKGKIPNEQTLELVLEALGYSLDEIARAWLEEFEPGHNAVNLLIPVWVRGIEGRA